MRNLLSLIPIPLSLLLLLLLLLAGLRPAFAAEPTQSPRAARRDRRYGWQESEPAPHRDRRSARRSIRDAPRRWREMHHPAWQNSSWWRVPSGTSVLTCGTRQRGIER